MTRNPARPSHPTVVAAGEALVDLVEQPGGALLPHAGGAVYNLARALALQGVATLYLNALSADRFGRRLARELEAAGVGLARPEPVTEPPHSPWWRWMRRARRNTASTAKAWRTASAMRRC